MTAQTQSFVAIVNVAAGHGRAAKLAPAALDRLRARGVQIDARLTVGPGDATRIAREALAEGHRHFIVVGGDGTAFETVNGVAERLGERDPERRIVLGFLPLGTGNSFLRDFGDASAETAAEAIVLGRKRSCDVAKLTHAGGVVHYINILSFGFVADVGAVTNRRFKPLGTAGYAAGVIAMLVDLKSKPMRLRIDAGALWEQDAIFVCITNSRFTGGGMMMAPYADTADGEVDVVVCGKLGRLSLLETFPKIFTGKHVHHHAVTSCRAKTVDLFEDAPLDLMLDGEIFHYKPERVEVLPSALDVLV